MAKYQKKSSRSPKGKILICPYCKKPMAVKMKNLENNPFFPVCSNQCKLADLDKWFSGEYSIEQPLEELTDEQLDDLPEPEE